MTEEEKLPGQGDKDNLSAFENALDGIDMSGVVKPMCERDIIREVLDRLSEEYGVEFAIHDGRGLGSPMALNHRLDALSTSSPRSLPIELTDAIQSNNMTYELGDLLVSKVCDHEELELFDSEQIERLLIDIYKVNEVVLYLEAAKSEEEHEIVLGQHEDVYRDIKSHDILLSSLHQAGRYIDEYIQLKPQRDNELINAVGRLNEYIESWHQSDKFVDSIPGGQLMVGQVLQRFSQALTKIPDSTKARRIEINNIIKRMRNSVKISLSWKNDDMKLFVDEQALNDVAVMIADLASP
ncbi:hypothetical protein HYT59_00885 [Candidatus Woesebacteria bacterium]|nr:hypothetical protein [Candidatus Woesebacteria bacterium]